MTPDKPTASYFPARTEPAWEMMCSKGIRLEVCCVEIAPEEYQIAMDAVESWWLNDKKGEWGHGLGNNSKDKKRVQRIGLLGEMAFAKIFGGPVQCGYAHRGNDYDFRMHGQTWEMKTATYNYDTGLIRAVSASGINLPLKANRYIFGYVMSERKEQKYAKIALVGTSTKNYVEKQPKQPARKGRHKNYEVPYAQAVPIRALWEKSKKIRKFSKKNC